MALEELLTSLREEADEEVGRLAARAREEAAAVVAAARDEAAALARQRVGLAREQAVAQAAETVAAAHLQAQAQRRAARTQELAAVADAAAAELDALQGTPRWADVLAGLLDEAWSVLPTAERVHVRPADAAAVAALLAARGRQAQVVDDPDVVGVVLRDAAGRLVDNTLATRLEAAWAALRPRVAARWAPEPVAAAAGSAA